MASLHGVYRGLLKGRHERGTGGVLYVKNDMCAYRFPNEFSDRNFCERLAEILTDDGDAHLFVVEDKSDGKLHLLAYPLSVVQEAVADAYRASRGGEGGEEGEGGEGGEGESNGKDAIQMLDHGGAPSGEDPAADPVSGTGSDLASTDPA